MLFPRPTKNPDGQRADQQLAPTAPRSTAGCDAATSATSTAEPVRLTPHQWRHTLGTRLINRDVPQEVVRRILDHDSPQMTAHYARLHDTTVRRHWEAARKVDITGDSVAIDPDGPLAEAAWAKQRLGRATQALPNGFCGLPVQKTCPHANACLTCPMFVTTAEFLPQHRSHRQQILADHHRRRGPRPDPAGRDEPAGRSATSTRSSPRWKPTSPSRRETVSRCGLTTPATSSPPPDNEHELTRAKAIRRRPARLDTRRHPDHLRSRRPRGRRLPILALHPTRPPRRDRTAARGHPPRPGRRRPGRQRPPTPRCCTSLQAANETNRLLTRREPAAPPPARHALGDQRTREERPSGRVGPAEEHRASVTIGPLRRGTTVSRPLSWTASTTQTRRSRSCRGSSAQDNDRVAQRPLPQGGAGTGPLPHRAGRVEVPVSGHQITRPHRTRQGTMDHEVEASTQRVRDHLRRPLAGSRDLLMKTAGNTVSEIDPASCDV